MRELNILISNVGDRAHNGALNRNRRGAQWCTPPAALVNQFRTSSLSTPALSTRLVCEARTLSPFAGRGHRKTVLRIDWRRLHQFQSHRRHTAIGYSQSSGSSVRKVNDPRFHERPAIIDPNHDAPTSIEAAHPHSGAKGKRPVRGCQLLLIVNLSAR